MSANIGDDNFPANDGNKRSALILENEILLMKLNAEFGAEIFFPDKRLPPEVENHFLRSVYSIESNTRSGLPKQTVFQKIGEPDFPDESSLDNAALEEAFQDLTDLLYAHRIVLDTLAEYSDRTLYNFIIKELFVFIVEDWNNADCYCHFCYEEFHPNHEYDLRESTTQFAENVIGQRLSPEFHQLHNPIRTSAFNFISADMAYQQIVESYKEFTRLELSTFVITEVCIQDQIAMVHFLIEYDAGFKTEVLKISGAGRLDFLLQDGYWFISALQFPGIFVGP
jgi:hypothetical protein